MSVDPKKLSPKGQIAYGKTGQAATKGGKKSTAKRMGLSNKRVVGLSTRSTKNVIEGTIRKNKAKKKKKRPMPTKQEIMRQGVNKRGENIYKDKATAKEANKKRTKATSKSKRYANQK